jgi:EAL domain-containing protein (putative c-di-GMP-specific phosphodiesterase class I)/ActR/RegA family two-component response regulator
MSGLGRVLVVDDEQALARAIGRMLTAAGYEVAIAADGIKAMDLLGTATFDAILSDIDMPGLNGVRFLQAVRLRDVDVPVVLMTGNPDVRTAVLAVEHGALRYLIKPVDMDELRKVMVRAVGLNRVAKLKREAFVLGGAGGFGPGDRVALEANFERALATLWMAYQPIVRVLDRTIFGYEALLRSEEKALPHPGAILDAAERLGRLDDLGRRIRAAACVPVAQAPPDAAFFINLHARDLMDDTLLSPRSPLSAIAERVVLEITERASLDQVKDARARVADLRRMGFRIAIDDLGAGYAGLTSFAALEPEFVKLDMSLVRDIDSNRTKEALVRSLVSVCRDLGMLVVAEGVETPAERDLLALIGCDFLQGYLLAKPGRPFPISAW